MANLWRAYPTIAKKVALLPIPVTATLAAKISLTSTTVAKNLEHCTLDAPITLTLTAQEDSSTPLRISAAADAPIGLTSTTAGDVVIPAQLDASIVLTPTIVAIYGQKALLAKSIFLTSASDVRVENKGQMSATLRTNHPLTLAGQAAVPNKGQLTHTFTLTLAGQAEDRSGKLTATIPITLTSATTQISSYIGAATLPALIGNAETSFIRSSVTLPALISNAVLLNSNTYIGAGTLPAFIASATTGHTSSTILPSFISDSLVTSGNVMSSSVSLPALTTDAVLVPDRSARSITTLPAFTGTSTVVSVSDATSVVNLPVFTADAIALAGIEAIGIVTLPSLIGNAVIQSGQIIVSVTTLPVLTGNAVADNGGSLVTTTHVFNTENMAATEYSNYDFLAMAMFNGVPVGISTTGVFELSGSDDDGVDIAIDVLSGFSDLGTEDLKRMSNVYLGYKSDGDIQVQISIDGEPAVRTYTVSKISSTSGIKRGRAKPGKGLKSKYWQVGVKNVLGSDLELNDLGLYVEQFNRKVQ